ncbi:MAG TPA: HDOD domain-containing protein [Burkholderiaceae bacterium]|nr:HDOD domain-containing protein [Burkholderiaceae bacterium]
MPVDPGLRRLDIDLPAQPGALARLSHLLAADAVDLAAASALIETDMALAAAVLRAVNSSLYGLQGRVRSVLQAAQFLGLREIAAITYEMALRAVFPPEPVLAPVWDRAARRGLLMGRLAQRLGVDGWIAHSAGLFMECGKAVLVKHAPGRYPAMLGAARSDPELAALERNAFGVSHEVLGAALVDTWGLAPAAVVAVRSQLALRAGAPLSAELAVARVQALAMLAHAVMAGEDAAAAVERVAEAALLDAALAIRAVDAVRGSLGDG